MEKKYVASRAQKYSVPIDPYCEIHSAQDPAWKPQKTEPPRKPKRTRVYPKKPVKPVKPVKPARQNPKVPNYRSGLSSEPIQPAIEPETPEIKYFCKHNFEIIYPSPSMEGNPVCECPDCAGAFDADLGPLPSREGEIREGPPATPKKYDTAEPYELEYILTEPCDFWWFIGYCATHVRLSIQALDENRPVIQRKVNVLSASPKRDLQYKSSGKPGRRPWGSSFPIAFTRAIQNNDPDSVKAREFAIQIKKGVCGSNIKEKDILKFKNKIDNFPLMLKFLSLNFPLWAKGETGRLTTNSPDFVNIKQKVPTKNMGDFMKGATVN